MAFIRDAHCHIHGVTSHTNGNCTECVKAKEAQAEAAWQALSIEDKVECLRQQLNHLARAGQRRY